jgi:cell wall-associated NlpC family hydrolase
VKYVLQSLRVDVPRTSREQSQIGDAIARDPGVLRPGDLLMFGRPNGGVSHVGIYVGNGRYVHASSIAGRVIESPIDRPPSALIKVLMSARRVLALTDGAPAPVAGRVVAAPTVAGAIAMTTLTMSTIPAKQKQ